MRFAHVALALAAALSARAAAPAGLTRDEWRQIRRSVKSPASFPHEAQLFGHGDPVGQQGAELGLSAALSGDTLVVGADAQDTPGGVDTGAAYVFVRSGPTWSEQQQLVAPDGLPNDHFGCSVAVSGDTAVAGACADDTAQGTDTGSAWVFVRSGATWTAQQQLLAPDGASGDAFGCSVAVSGDTALAGACGGEGPIGGANTGSVYVFVRAGVTWTPQQELYAADVGSNAQFGYSTSISGDTVVVGAPYADLPAGADAGSAYVFVRSGTTWSLQQKFRPYDPTPNAKFGWSVSISADTLVVGAPTAAPAGAAYVYRRFGGTTWVQQQKLTAPASAVQFG